MKHRTNRSTGRGRRRPRVPLRHVALLSLATALTGCGNVTAGGVSDTEVYMTADGSPQSAPASSPARAAAAEPEASAPARAVVLPGGLQGDVDVTASLFLLSAGTLVPLTDEPFTVVLDVAGTQESLVARASVPSGSYDGLVVRFTEVTAQVTGGLEIEGIPFAGTVEVDLGAGALEVTRSFDLDVGDGDTMSLRVDLDADGWIPLLEVVDVLTGIVASADFSAAVTVIER